MYFGPVGQRFRGVLDYMERTFGEKCPPAVNPADWILEVTLRAHEPPPHERWAHSEEEKNIDTERQQATQEQSEAKFTKRYALPLWYDVNNWQCMQSLNTNTPTDRFQVGLSLKRFWLSLWRDSFLFTFDLLRNLALGLLLGTIFWYLSAYREAMSSPCRMRPYDQLGVNEFFSVLFISAVAPSLSGVRVREGRWPLSKPK